MKRSAKALVGLVLALVPACQGDFFGDKKVGPSLVVELQNGDAVSGSQVKPLPLAINTPQPYHVIVRAMDVKGNVDTSFNGYVRISAQPGSVDRIDSPAADGRNLMLTNGVSPDVVVNVTNAYGSTFIVADDLGYQPADPTAHPPPECSDGRDNDGDGKVDFGSSDAVNDPGCAFANDNTETGGTYSEGVTQPIYYALPRVADLRGLTCNAAGVCSGSGKTPYPGEQLLIDTGLHNKADGSQAFDYNMVVTRISQSGFYVSDTADTRGGFTGLYAFNFSAPPGMRVCDRLKTFTGTASEFFGFTQLGYPTWTLEEWDPQQRPCLVPEPQVLGPGDVIGDFNGDGVVDVPTTLLPETGSLMRVLTSPQDKVVVKISSKFGPGLVPQDPNSKAWLLSADASNCDLNNDKSIDFSNGSLEAACNTACQLDPDCTEYSNYVAHSTFQIWVSDGNTNGKIQADATESPTFDPTAFKGQTIKSFTGILTFFSGGSQYTIEARCTDDIVTDPNAEPLPSDKACVTPRTDFDEDPQ